MSDPERDRRERAERVEAQRAAADRRRAKESERAQLLVDRFIADAVRAGLPTEELTARPWRGGGRYRTGITGWYLRNNRSIGVGTDGDYYVLIVPPMRFGRWRTVHLSPTPPPLRVGEGARDGESIDLAELLEMRLSE
jgi:hypothetical protein